MHARAILAVLCLSLPVAAQSAGFKNFTFGNGTGQGSTPIAARLYYPATSAGQNAPLIPTPGGYPVVVFLHGLGRVGNDYTLAGAHLATNGYVAVLANTVSANLIADGIALFPSLQAINAVSGHFLEGALDMTRAGVLGHSMGGGNVVSVLAAKAGYKAGMSLAPVNPGAATTNQVDVPLGVIHGMGDIVVGWQVGGLPIFNDAIDFTGVKFLYLFNSAGNHDNVAGVGSGSLATKVWLRCARVLTGFFDCYLKDDAGGLSEVAGFVGRFEPRLSDLYIEVEQPELWVVGTPTVGESVRVELMAEPAQAWVLTAATTGSTGTRFGTLLLDPATVAAPLQGIPDIDRLATWLVEIPASLPPGFLVPLQGFGLSNQGGYRFTDLFTLPIE